MRFYFVIMFFIFTLSSFASDLDATFTIVPINKNKIVFNVVNNSDFQYFCRSVKVEGVEFLDGGSTISFEDIKAENISIYPKENVNFPQSITGPYKDILDVFSSATINVDPSAKVVMDCEKKIRTNNILVVENRNRCNGDGIYLNKYLIDNGNSRLSQVSSFRIDSQLDGKLFRLHSRVEIASVTKDEIKLINFNTDSLKSMVLPYSDKRGAIVSLIDYSTTGLALISLNQEGLYFELFDQVGNDLKLIDDYQTDIGKILLNRQVINYKEALAFVKEELSSMAANMIIASFYEPYSKIIKLNISFRKPVIEAIAVDYDPKTQNYFFKYSFIKTTGSRSKFFVNINLETLALAQSQVNLIGPGEFNNNVMTGQLNNNSYNINSLLIQNNSFLFKNNILKVSMDGIETKISDLCQINGLFSDKLVSFLSKDLNTRFNGVTALINFIDKNDYESVIDLIGKGADVNKPDIAFFTPLDHAVRIGSYKIIKALIENGADFYNLSKGKSSLTAILYQRFLGNVVNLDIESLKVQSNLFRSYMMILKKYGYRIDKDSFGSSLQIKRIEIKNKIDIDIFE